MYTSIYNVSLVKGKITTKDVTMKGRSIYITTNVEEEEKLMTKVRTTEG
jgi:hypothetical protein